jgi:YVTN family beta-propeller protein
MPIGVLLLAVSLTGAGSKVRIVQTNSAGDSVHLIDPATNRVVGEIKDIEVNHGAAAAPDGSHLYISNEAESSLDVVDAKTLKVTKRIPLSHSNNLSISRDGPSSSRSQAPGAVDVVDTSSDKVKSIPIEGGDTTRLSRRTASSSSPDQVAEKR